MVSRGRTAEMSVELSTPPTLERRAEPDAARRQILEINARLRCTEDALNDQFSLFHNLYARENRVFSWLSILVIVFSSLMTFLSAIDFLVPDAMRESGYDRVPSLVLSFLTTLICSVVKFFSFEARLNDTREGAERTQNQIREVEVARECIDTWLSAGAEITDLRLDTAHKVLGKAVKHYHDNIKLLLKLPPDIILKFEKDHQMRSLRRQKRQISRDISRLFQKKLDRMRREVAASASQEIEPLGQELQMLTQIHRHLLDIHSTITDYTNDFSSRLGLEEVQMQKTWTSALWARIKLVWFKLCCCKQSVCSPRSMITSSTS